MRTLKVKSEKSVQAQQFPHTETYFKKGLDGGAHNQVVRDGGAHNQLVEDGDAHNQLVEDGDAHNQLVEDDGAHNQFVKEQLKSGRRKRFHLCACANCFV